MPVDELTNQWVTFSEMVHHADGQIEIRTRRIDRKRNEAIPTIGEFDKVVQEFRRPVGGIGHTGVPFGLCVAHDKVFQNRVLVTEFNGPVANLCDI